MARFLCTFKVKEEDGSIALKSKIFTTKTDDVELGRVELLVKLSKDYDIPAQFVNKYTEDTGVIYINPHKYYCPTELCDEDMDDDE
jgi:hypothetical protein